MSATEKQTAETWDAYVQQHGNKPVTVDLLNVFVDHVIHFLEDMNTKNAQRNRRLDALEERMKDAMVYRGVWGAGHIYTCGDTVTRSGAIWLCRAEATQRAPGSAAEDWTLAAKSAGEPR